MNARPYSPESLGERWGCSAEKVRRMCHDGELSAFRLGKLIRIPASEVERVECQTNTGSESTGDDSASSTQTRSADAFESRLERLTAAKPRQEHAPFGRNAPPHQRTG